MSNKIDLNDLRVETDSGSQSLSDFSAKIDKPTFDSAEVIFRDAEKRLIELINEYKDGAIFGCIAWLTSKPILKALADCKNVQIIVQKEDFLRPDLDTKINSNWKKELQKLYNGLQFSFTRYDCKEPICDLSILGDPSVDPIRCVGNHNADKSPAFPRAHHKFLVFCKLDNDEKYLPISAWTGSFNLTFNATKSFENVVLLTDKSGKNEIINSFFKRASSNICIIRTTKLDRHLDNTRIQNRNVRERATHNRVGGPAAE